MIIQNKKILIPVSEGHEAQLWAMPNDDNKPITCKEACGRIIPSTSRVSFSSGGGSTTIEIGLTMPTKCETSTSWLTAEFVYDKSSSVSISHESLIDNGEMKTYGLNVLRHKYFAIDLSIHADANSSSNDRTGTIRFYPNGWSSPSFSENTQLTSVNGTSPYSITVLQERKGYIIIPPTSGDPGPITSGDTGTTTKGTIRIYFEKNSSAQYHRVSFRIDGKTYEYADGSSQVSIPNPYDLYIDTGTYTITIVSAGKRDSQTQNWQMATATASPSSVTVREGRTVSTTITIS